MPNPKTKNEAEKFEDSYDLKIAFDNYYDVIFKYIKARIQDKEISENITQEAFIKAWNKRDSFDAEISSLKNWLFIIAINTMRDFFRKNKFEIEEIDENIISEEDIEGVIEQDMAIEYVHTQIKKLSKKEQCIILLRFKDDMKMKEIAEEMNMKNSAVKVAVHRAIKKLQALCKELDC